MRFLRGGNDRKHNEYEAGNFSVVQESKKPCNREGREYDRLWKGREERSGWPNAFMIAQKPGDRDRQHEEGEEGSKPEHGEVALQHEDALQYETKQVAGGGP